jgi:hypothetical protein
MTGPEHYLAAIRLANQANHFTYGDGADPDVGAALAAEAQVHATLAQTAATIEAASLRSVNGMPEAWRAVLRGEQKAAS